MQQQTADMERLKEQRNDSVMKCEMLEGDASNSEGDMRLYKEQVFQLQKSYKEACDERTVLRRDLTELRRNFDMASHTEAASIRADSVSRAEVDRLRKEFCDKENELENMKRLLDEVQQSHAPMAELQKWRKRAQELEAHYQHAVHYNKEITSAVGHMTQAASERGGDLSDIQQLSVHLQRECDQKDQELRMAELEREDMQKQWENLSSSCTYFQNKCKTTAAETKKWQQEHAAMSGKATQLAQMAANSQRETEQLKAQISQLQCQLGDFQRSG